MKHVFAPLILAVGLISCAKSPDEESLAPPPMDIVDFANALDVNTHSSYANFVAKHPDSVFYKMAIELYTEAAILGGGAALATVDKAKEALADGLPTSDAAE